MRRPVWAAANAAVKAFASNSPKDHKVSDDMIHSIVNAVTGDPQIMAEVQRIRDAVKDGVPYLG
jgi:hypothetical protein